MNSKNASAGKNMLPVKIETDRGQQDGSYMDILPSTCKSTDVLLSPGTCFKLGEIAVELMHCLSLDRVVVRERQTGETRVVTRAALQPINRAAESLSQPAIKPECVSEELLAQITARERALQPYVSSGVLPRVDAHRIAKTFEVSSRTVRRWLRRYQRRGDVTAFIPAQR